MPIIAEGCGPLRHPGNVPRLVTGQIESLGVADQYPPVTGLDVPALALCRSLLSEP
jgi:hypothetical protein